MEGCDAHVPWTLFLAGGGAEVSDVPQSLLEALDSSASVFRAKKAVEEWFAAHDVVEVVRCKDCQDVLIEGDVTQHYECGLDGGIVNPYEYCADGRRRER